MDLNSILNQVGGAGAIARQLGVDQATVESGVGALLPGEKHNYSFSVDLMPVRAVPERKRN